MNARIQIKSAGSILNETELSPVRAFSQANTKIFREEQIPNLGNQRKNINSDSIQTVFESGPGKEDERKKIAYLSDRPLENIDPVLSPIAFESALIKEKERKYKQELEKRQAELEKMEKQMRDLNDKIAFLEETKKQITADVNDKGKECARVNDALRKEVQQLKDTINSQEKDLNERSELLNTLEKEKRTLESRVSEVNEKHQQLLEKQNSVQTECGAAYEKVQKVEQDLATKKRENETLTAELETVARKFEKTTAERDQMEKECNQSSEQGKKFQKEIDEKNATLTQLEQDKKQLADAQNQLSEQVKTLTDQKEQCENQMQEKTKEMNNIKQEVENTSSTCQNLQEKMEKLEDEKKSLENEKANLKQVVEETKNRLAEAKEEEKKDKMKNFDILTALEACNIEKKQKEESIEQCKISLESDSGRVRSLVDALFKQYVFTGMELKRFYNDNTPTTGLFNVSEEVKNELDRRITQLVELADNLENHKHLNFIPKHTMISVVEDISKLLIAKNNSVDYYNDPGNFSMMTSVLNNFEILMNTHFPNDLYTNSNRNFYSLNKS